MGTPASLYYQQVRGRLGKILVLPGFFAIGPSTPEIHAVHIVQSHAQPIVPGVVNGTCICQKIASQRTDWVHERPGKIMLNDVRSVLIIEEMMAFPIHT